MSDQGRFSISAETLYQRFGSANVPVIVDVRRAPAFDSDDRIIAGALRCLPEKIAAWPRDQANDRPVVVYCVHGHEVSQGAAETLRGLGIDARYLAGGIAAWVEQQLPTQLKAGPASHLWVTRERPKIDRVYGIADPALDGLALIVRGADTGRLDLTPQSAGLLAITLGLSANSGEDDHAMLEASMPVYDALYAWCRSLQHEAHNRTPTAKT